MCTALHAPAVFETVSTGTLAQPGKRALHAFTSHKESTRLTFQGCWSQRIVDFEDASQETWSKE
jgi:hypothetical protein